MNSQWRNFVHSSLPPSKEQYESLEECIADIPQHILVGSLRGSYVHGLHRSVENVYKDAAQFQFREPARVQDDVADGGDGLVSPAEDERETGKCIIQFIMTMEDTLETLETLETFRCRANLFYFKWF